MDYITIIVITCFIVGVITWMWTKTSVEDKWEKKWRLGICHDPDTELGWQPLLERYLDNHHWEYIYINKENLPLIRHIAYLNVPSVPSPLASSKEDRLFKMLKDMVNRGHGRITGIKKEKNS